MPTNDLDVFEALYPALCRFAAAVRPIGMDPEDLVHEALARTLATRALTSIEEPEAYLRTAMIRIAANLARGARRAYARSLRQSVATAALDSYPSDLDDLLRVEPRARAVLYLTIVEGEPYRTAAELIGCTEPAARALASRALRAAGGSPRRARPGGVDMSDELRDRLERLASAQPHASAAGLFERARRRAQHLRRHRARRRGVSLGAAVVAVAVAVAFVIHAQPDRHALNVKATRPPKRTTTTPIATTTTAKQPPELSGCIHHPTVTSSDYYYGVPAPKAPSIAFDSADGDDGRGDTITTPNLEVEKTGPRGTVILTHGRSHYDIVLRGFGDFDGDGRTDLIVDLSKTNGATDTYIVPGTLGPGTFDPAVYGVPVPQPHVNPGEVSWFPAAVGDQNQDGDDDVAFGPRVYSGRELMAGHAGSPLPAPIEMLSAEYVGLVKIDANGPPSFVVPSEPTASFELTDHRHDRLLIDGTPGALSLAINTGAQAAGWLVNGHHIVQVSYTADGFGMTWRWDVDAPCGK